MPTAKGEDFAFVDWGNRHYAAEGESVQVADRDIGRRLQLAFTDPEDGRVLAPQQCTVQPGPAASDAMRERLGCKHARPVLTT